MLDLSSVRRAVTSPELQPGKKQPDSAEVEHHSQQQPSRQQLQNQLLNQHHNPTALLLHKAMLEAMMASKSNPAASEK